MCYNDLQKFITAITYGKLYWDKKIYRHAKFGLMCTPCKKAIASIHCNCTPGNFRFKPLLSVP